MSITTEPYKALFACRSTERNEDGDCVHDDYCDWGWECNICGRDVTKDPCPDHAPRQVPGLHLVECENSHPRTWLLEDDGGYGAPCPWCLYEAARDAHEGCAHSHHGPWRRWKATNRVLYRLSLLGVVAGRTTSYGGGCHGCATRIRFGRNDYLLGVPRWKWTCVLVNRHWPGQQVAFGLCGKCAPCPSCGSETARCNPGCEVSS